MYSSSFGVASSMRCLASLVMPLRSARFTICLNNLARSFCHTDSRASTRACCSASERSLKASSALMRSSIVSLMVNWSVTGSERISFQRIGSPVSFPSRRRLFTKFASALLSTSINLSRLAMASLYAVMPSATSSPILTATISRLIESCSFFAVTASTPSANASFRNSASTLGCFSCCL